MGSGSTTKFITLLCALLILSSMGGAFAAWSYASAPTDARNSSAGLSLAEFIWAPEDILPTETPGENYMDLLTSLLENSKGGLNSGKDTLEKAVRKYHVVHCEQNVTGGNLKHLRDLFTDKSEMLDFIVQYKTDTEFHVYIFETDDVEQGTVDVTQIKVYKTILLLEKGKWAAGESQFGHAPLRYLSGTSYIAINPTEWVKGPLPE